MNHLLSFYANKSQIGERVPIKRNVRIVMTEEEEEKSD